MARERVSDRVHDHLLRRIATGHFQTGDRLPPERTLADDLGASRPAVREAVQRLAQANLVEMRQGDGTRVLDVAATAGPDLLHVLIRDDDGRLVPALAERLLDLRRMFNTDAAALAAVGASPRTVDRLGQALGDLGGARTPAEGLARVESFWHRVVAAADNLPLRLTSNAIRPHVDQVLGAGVSAFVVGPPSPAYGELLGAIASGRVTAARELADKLLAADTGRVMVALQAPVARPSAI